MKIHIDIDRKWFEKTKEEFIKNFNNDKFEDRKDTHYRIEYDLGKNQDKALDDEGNIKASGGDEDLYVTVFVEPDIDSMINLGSILAKYYNKAKTVIEALR